MPAYLKVYQEKWVVDIAIAESDEEVLEVCQLILADDTGDTDELSAILADELRKRLL